MRRVVLHAPWELTLEDRPDPTPAPDEILVLPDAVGICGTDIELLDGSMPYLTKGISSYPLVPGHEWTGRVAAVGRDVVGFEEGDRVVGEVSVGCGRCESCVAGLMNRCAQRTETGLIVRDGALSTQMLFPARAAHRVPASVDRLDAVLIEPLAIAYRGLRRAGPQLPRAVAVVGGGTIGLLVALAARALGAERVSVIELDASRRDFATSLGLEALERGDPRSAPLVVEASGGSTAFAAATELCADGGTVVVLGFTGKPSVSTDLDGIVLRDLTIKGSLSSPGIWPEVIDLVASKRVVPSPLVSHERSIEDVAAAFELVHQGAPGVRKVVIDPARTKETS